jgi:hypothetical protein
MPKPTKSDVELVIEEYKRIGPKVFANLYHYQQSTRYDLLYGGERFPPKAIYNVALKRALGKDDKTGNDSGLAGGEAVNKPLEQLNFRVVPKDDVEVDLDEPDAGLDGRAQRTIGSRRGQRRFRKLLLNVYGGLCAVTNSHVADILDACHVKPYSDFRDYAINNGILLRTDIHTLFDLGLVKINPDDLRIHVAKSITDQEYRKLDGRLINCPKNKSHKINIAFLRERWQRSL